MVDYDGSLTGSCGSTVISSLAPHLLTSACTAHPTYRFHVCPETSAGGVALRRFSFESDEAATPGTPTANGTLSVQRVVAPVPPPATLLFGSGGLFTTPGSGQVSEVHTWRCAHYCLAIS